MARFDTTEQNLNVIADGVDNLQTVVAPKIQTALTGIGDDITKLKTEIDRLNNLPPGPWTPEDQAQLDRIIALASSASAKQQAVTTAFGAMATALKTLDEATG